MIETGELRLVEATKHTQEEETNRCFAAVLEIGGGIEAGLFDGRAFV